MTLSKRRQHAKKTKKTIIIMMIIIGGGKQLCVLPPENFLGRVALLPCFAFPANNSYNSFPPKTLGAGINRRCAATLSALVCTSATLCLSLSLSPTLPPSLSPSLQEFKPAVECLSLNSGVVKKWKLQMSQLYSNTPVLKKKKSSRKGENFSFFFSLRLSSPRAL